MTSEPAIRWHHCGVELTIELVRAFGLLAADGVSVECPEPATDGHLETVHVPLYIAAVRQAGDPEPALPELCFGLRRPSAPTPAPWREHVVRRTRLAAPEQMTEGTPAVFQPFESG